MTPVPIEAIADAVGVKDVAAPRKAKPAVGIVHRTLRAATRNDHALIDRMLLPFALSRVDDYRMFLGFHFAALVSLRADWRVEDSEDFEQMLRCVEADLKTLGRAPPPVPVPLRTPATASTGLGIAYVVRGSRLGGAVLRRSVTGDLPTSYLDFVPALSWAQFLPQLESIVGDANARDDATRAARAAFNTFYKEFMRLQGGDRNAAVLNESGI
jgi:heme oxygenase